MLTNDKDGLWVNGSTGTVQSVGSESVKVILDRDKKTIVVKETYEEIMDGDGNEIAKIYQYPMQLAWALTIHRAQGMTMDKVGVDLNGHFETGQTYVAMSRCRTKEGLSLMGDMGEILVDKRALDQCK